MRDVVAVLSHATRADPLALLKLVRDDPRMFDAMWYLAFPPPRQGGCDIDAILAGDE